MSRRFDLLIFDWDGTLADSEALIVGTMQAAIAELSLPSRTDRQIGELIGLGLNEALQALYPEKDLAELRVLLDGYRKRYVTASLREAPLFPGVLETLSQLRESGYRLAIATGKSRRGLERSLAEHGELRALISSSRCADETASKPDPVMLRELLEEEDVSTDRALMVGDTEYDVAMAAGLSVPAVGVVCGVHDPGRLLQAGAVAVIEEVRHLPGWLSGQGTLNPA